MDSWDTFAVIIGGSAAALLGLFFVAISIRLNIVAASAELRNRAAQTLVLFGSVLLVAILLSVPDQSPLVLGIELTVLAIVTGVGLELLDRRASTPTGSQRIGPVLALLTPSTITSVLLLASGVVLMFGSTAGLYVLVAPVLTAFVCGLANAWLFMIRLQDQPAR